MLIRKPHVAGSFYPSDAAELREFCESHLTPSVKEIPVRGIILPHAGYVYSGATACRVLSQVKVPDTVLLIGPNHWSVGSRFSLYAYGEWETPLGRVPVASDLAAALIESCHDLRIDEPAHAEEHSLEVELPFLQTRNPRVSIVPLIVGTMDYDEVRGVAEAVGEVLKSQSKPVLVAISNDMNHYEPDGLTRQKDRYALDAIEALDPEALRRAVEKHRISMCGLMPVYMLLCMKDKLGIQKATLVDYRTSADASGDKSRVVGYAGFLFE
jgi:AmmeMemoRadiSam system protein B